MTHVITLDGTRRSSEQGSAMLTMVFLLLPLAMILGSFLTSMHGRTQRLRAAVDEERALQAAEAGIDAALFAARTATLYDATPVAGTLPDGSTFDVMPTYLGADGLNNDGDLDTDEADEDVFRIVSTGNSRGVPRVIATYLGRTSFLPSVGGAVTSHNPAMIIDLGGTSSINGNNINIDGTAGNPADSLAGMSIASPGTTANLLAQLTPAEQAKVTGVGGTPSLSVTPALDLVTLAAVARNAANLVLTNHTYSGLQFGNASLGTGFITYREGDVRFQGNVQGAGLLVVTGNLTLAGTFRFDGIIICLGEIDNAAGTADVFGGVITASSSPSIKLRGTSQMRFSKEAVDLAKSLAGQYVAFNGWQELKRN
jgi:Tfp pilus assembly protein PilX